MNKFLVVLTLLFCVHAVSAEEFVFPTASDYPSLPKNGKIIDDFVPKSWSTMGKVFGDLNADKNADCVLIMKANDRKFLNKNDGLGEKEFDTNPRVLAVLFKDENGYQLAAQSNTLIKIPEAPTMSEPFLSAKIKNGVLQLDFEVWYSAGSWGASQYSYKFQHRNSDFVLIGADKTELQRNTGEIETRSYNFLTNKMNITAGRIDTNAKKKVQWKTFKIDRLKTLDTLKELFAWEVEPNHFL